MAKLVLDGKLARALAVIGGRELKKVVDSLLARVKETLAFKDLEAYSDRVRAYIKIDGRLTRVEIQPKEAEISSGYFVFQDGLVEFLGPEQDLRLIKNALVEIAKERAEYILSRYKADQLAYYDLTPEYVRTLPKRVEKLEIE